jgi:hypothetical protein
MKQQEYVNKKMPAKFGVKQMRCGFAHRLG